MLAMYKADILDKLEKFMLNEKYEEWERERKKVSVLFEITPCCNFRCVHCYVGTERDSSHILSFDEIIRIIDILYDNGILFLTFSGGDPFTRPDFKDIYLYAKKKGFVVEILTNATLIDEDWGRLLQEYPSLLVDISIYGASNATYEKVTGIKNGYDCFIRGITILRTAHVRFALKGILLKENYKELKQMEQMSKEYTADNFRYSYELVVDRQHSDGPRLHEVDPLEGVLNEIERGSLSEMMRQRGKEISLENDINTYRDGMVFRCNIGSLSVHINYYGEMGSCVECVERKNILQYPFDEICDGFEQYKQAIAPDGYKCSDCKYKTFCVSCPLARKREYGDELIVLDKDCIVAKLKYLYYVDNLSVEELKDYYRKNYRR